MCIIVCKEKWEKNSDIKEATLQWIANPDGAGVMWRGSEGWHGPARFMKLNEFINHLARIPDGAEVIYHVRIATHGEVTITNTHPYRVKDGVWLFHNGVVLGTPADKGGEHSDTYYVAKKISGMRYNDAFSYLQEKAFGNRFLLLWKGAVIRIGDWVKVERGWASHSPNAAFSHKSFLGSKARWLCDCGAQPVAVVPEIGNKDAVAKLACNECREKNAAMATTAAERLNVPSACFMCGGVAEYKVPFYPADLNLCPTCLAEYARGEEATPGLAAHYRSIGRWYSPPSCSISRGADVCEWCGSTTAVQQTQIAKDYSPALCRWCREEISPTSKGYSDAEGGEYYEACDWCGWRGKESEFYPTETLNGDVVLLCQWCHTDYTGDPACAFCGAPAIGTVDVGGLYVNVCHTCKKEWQS